MTTASPLQHPRLHSPTRIGPVLVAMSIGAVVSIGLGLFGRLHHPTGVAINLAGFSSGLAVKTWLTTAAFSSRSSSW